MTTVSETTDAATTNYANSPAAIREQAEMIAKTYSFDEAILAGAICAALVMERERAAKIVAQYGNHPDDGVAFISDEIAVAIRGANRLATT